MKFWKVGLASVALSIMLSPMAVVVGAAETTKGYTALEGVTAVPMTAQELGQVEGMVMPRRIGVPEVALGGVLNNRSQGVPITLQNACPGGNCGAQF